MIYRIKKTYRNGEKIFYIELSDSEKLSDSMLESIGDNTDGGHNYGYKITARKISKLPKGEKILPRTISQRVY